MKDILEAQLGYGEEVSISTEQGILYDLDLEDNLPKKLSEMGIHNETFITVMDEEDQEPRVNLELIASTQK